MEVQQGFSRGLGSTTTTLDSEGSDTEHSGRDELGKRVPSGTFGWAGGVGSVRGRCPGSSKPLYVFCWFVALWIPGML